MNICCIYDVKNMKERDYSAYFSDYRDIWSQKILGTFGSTSLTFISDEQRTEKHQNIEI